MFEPKKIEKEVAERVQNISMMSKMNAVNLYDMYKNYYLSVAVFSNHEINNRQNYINNNRFPI